MRVKERLDARGSSRKSSAAVTGLRKREPALLVIAPTPPPVTGQTLVTARLLDVFIERNLRVVLADTAPVRDRSWRSLFARLVRLGSALLMIPATRLRGAKAVYISVLANHGMYHTALCALLARLLGYRLFLHHHSSAYAKSRVARMRSLSACAGKRATHITLCKAMSSELMEKYPYVARTLVLSNPFAVCMRQSGGGIPSQRIFCLGHLGNLTMEKGLGTVIELFGRLRAGSWDIRLIVAGPSGSSIEACALAQAERQFGKRFQYIGTISGEQKAEFFRTIDVFLFPSLYSNEAAPLVCLEAMAAGVPFIAYDWGYLRSATANAGTYIRKTQDFADQALPILCRWMCEPDELTKRSRAVRAVFRQLLERSCDELDELISRMPLDRAGTRAAT